MKELERVMEFERMKEGKKEHLKEKVNSLEILKELRKQNDRNVNERFGMSGEMTIVR